MPRRIAHVLKLYPEVASEPVLDVGCGTSTPHLRYFGPGSVGVDGQDVKLHTWVLTPVTAGNLTLSPANPTVKAGAPTTITANWTGLTPGRIYLGIVQFGQGGNLTNATGVTVRT